MLVRCLGFRVLVLGPGPRRGGLGCSFALASRLRRLVWAAIRLRVPTFFELHIVKTNRDALHHVNAILLQA